MRRRLSLLAGALLMTPVGCGGPADDFDRRPVSGAVTIDGIPLAIGMITFAPTSAPEPVATAIIEDGSYELPRGEGPAVGTQRVSIFSRQPTGRQVPDPYDPETLVDEQVEIVPDRYNLRSQLSADVADAGPNTFDFALEGAIRQASGGQASTPGGSGQAR